MEETTVIKAYDRLARGYDHLFGPIFNPGRRRIIERMGCQGGERVLEVGVGTGLSLPYYPQDTAVVGIDVSDKMLAVARERVARQGLNNVALHRMDAQAMAFEDDSFDTVVAMYVASVVPDDARMSAEMRRVCRPGGDLFVVNHFTHHNRHVRRLERLVTRATPFLGFDADFPLEPFLQRAGFRVLTIEPVNLGGYWSVIHARNEAA